MPELSSFPITRSRPASLPDRLQLCATPTPDGVKIPIVPEETGLAFEPHLIDNESKDPAFVPLKPSGHIPARPAAQPGLNIRARPA